MPIELSEQSDAEQVETIDAYIAEGWQVRRVQVDYADDCLVSLARATGRLEPHHPLVAALPENARPAQQEVAEGLELPVRVAAAEHAVRIKNGAQTEGVA